MADSGNIKVVVRCRPLNTREKTRGASKLITVVDQHQLVLDPPNASDSRENAKATKKRSMPFSFDRSYDDDTEQQTLFDYVGLDLLEHSFNGFNTCVFAYGQTGSGKSHSMMGYAEAKGLIPRICSRLFSDAHAKMDQDANLRITVEVSYIEIYNEKVRDLLNPKNTGNLRVREHPSMGPYVEDLSKLVVSSFADVDSLMDEGNKARTVAATNMNETSSRSHAVFTLVLTQRRKDEQTQLEAEKVSRISLVDLAGSERANSTGATGSRLKEGANINRSLTSLGKVIAALAQASMDTAGGPKKKGRPSATDFIPYRDSVLTWLLKDSLGGNSKTAMIAAISPADYEETLSTLRYADQAKKIKNKAVVNEDPNAKLIRELKEELDMLRSRVTAGGGSATDTEGQWDPSVPPEKQLVRYRTKSGEIKTVTKAELQEQLEQSEKLMSSLNESWEEKLARTQVIQQEREKALEELGITIDKGNVGVRTPKNLPHLVNLNEDALMNECLLYQLKPGKTTVGNLDSTNSAQIRLSGSHILPEHCTFENADGVVTLHAMPNSMTMVNGKRIAAEQPKRLRSGYRIILGDFHVFRLNNPGEVRRARDRVKSAMAGEVSLDSMSRSDSPVSDDEHAVDWTYARREVIMNHLNGEDISLDNLSNDHLDRLFEDIARVRNRKLGGGSTSQLGRPESGLSSRQDDSEASSLNIRPYSSYTDDTSLDPWSQTGSDRGAVNESSSAPLPAMTNEEGDSTAAEAELLRARIKEYEERFSKLDLNGSINNDVELSPQQRRLAQVALKKWRTRTDVSMATTVLSYAALLKEANIISRELRKEATYQFTIVDAEPLTNPVSGIEAIAGLTEFDDVADPQLSSGSKPCVAVKVVDFLHNAIYIWSVTKLEQQLQKMRNLYAFIDRPEYSQHFNWADPFYETPVPAFTYLGSALVPLSPLRQRISGKYRLAIVSPQHDTTAGTCSVEVRFISVAAPPARHNAANGSDREASMLPTGHKLAIEISIDEVNFAATENFREAHIQLRLSSIAGPSVEKDDSFASVPVNLQSQFSDLRLRKSVTLIITPENRSYLQHGLASVEFHVKPTHAHLRRIVETDEAKAFAATPNQKNNNQHLSTERPGLPHQPHSHGRLAETELVSDRRHDILASVQICELDASGEYKPLLVRSTSALDPGVFHLRQGLQRKIILRLTHDSGKQLNWSKVTRMEVGDVRLLDEKGRVNDASFSQSVTLPTPPKHQDLDFFSNGVSELSLWSWWDSSIHDCIFLNRVSSAGQRVLLRLSFDVEIEDCDPPPRFSMDIAVCIKARDSKQPGKFASLIDSATTGARTLSRASGVFAVKLTPPQTLKSTDLWRLDTSNKYVRGQEGLGRWRPFGPSFIEEHETFLARQKAQSYNEGWRVLLQEDKAYTPPMRSSAVPLAASRALELWQHAMKQKDRRRRLGQVPSPDTVAGQGVPSEHNGHGGHERPTISPRPSQTETCKVPFRASVSLLPRNGTAAKKGWLMLPMESITNQWTKRWFVLRRPHLFVYADSSESDELLAIYLSSVRVEHDPNTEQLLGRKGIIGLYTASNSYFLQAQTQTEMESWMAALHGFHLRKRE